MYEKIPKYPVAGSFLIVLAAFAFLKGTPGDSRAAEIMKHALLSAAMLYTMYLAGGKEFFRWEKGSLGESIWLYKSMLIINFALVVFTFIVFLQIIFGQELNGYVDTEKSLGSAGIMTFVTIGIKLFP